MTTTTKLSTATLRRLPNTRIPSTRSLVPRELTGLKLLQMCTRSTNTAEFNKTQPAWYPPVVEWAGRCELASQASIYFMQTCARFARLAMQAGIVRRRQPQYLRRARGTESGNTNEGRP